MITYTHFTSPYYQGKSFFVKDNQPQSEPHLLFEGNAHKVSCEFKSFYHRLVASTCRDSFAYGTTKHDFF